MGEIAKLFPKADHFYDLFGGGFSATHYMLVNRRKSFKQFHYNELRSGMCELISDAIAGKYNYKVFKPDWISRERFFAEKENDPSVCSDELLCSGCMPSIDPSSSRMLKLKCVCVRVCM